MECRSFRIAHSTAHADNIESLRSPAEWSDFYFVDGDTAIADRPPVHPIAPADPK